MKFGLNQYLIDDIENNEHPSDFNLQKDIGILILRLPYIDIEKEKIEINSYAFLIKDDTVYKFNRKNKEFEFLGNFEKLHNYLDVIVDKILAKINRLHVKISKMEDELYDGEMKNFSEIWLECKKELVIIERTMEHALIVFERFLRVYKEKVENYSFLDLKEHIERSHNFTKTAIEKLDYLYDFYKTKQDEKMNNLMFIFTIISAVFLPLSLVTGFFGMNTGGLPFTEENGTLKVVILSVIFESIFLVWIYKLIKK
jgi:magnesium transporter